MNEGVQNLSGGDFTTWGKNWDCGRRTRGRGEGEEGDGDCRVAVGGIFHWAGGC